MVSVVPVTTHTRVSSATVSARVGGRVPVATGTRSRPQSDQQARLPTQRGGAEPVKSCHPRSAGCGPRSAVIPAKPVVRQSV